MLQLLVVMTDASSSGHLATLASGSVAQSKAQTRQSMKSSAIENSTTANNSLFATFLQRKQMAEDFELRQHQINVKKPGLFMRRSCLS
jgi:hypothetical protein